MTISASLGIAIFFLGAAVGVLLKRLQWNAFNTTWATDRQNGRLARVDRRFSGEQGLGKEGLGSERV